MWFRARQHVGERYAARLTRALPLDEVLLQLAELSRHGVGADTVEVWTAGDVDSEVDRVRLELGASVPHAAPTRLWIRPAERDVLLAAIPRGRSWLEVWLPELSSRSDPGPCVVAPMVHSGRLHGLLVAVRHTGRGLFSDRDEALLADLAHRTAVALHNVQLDSALDATVTELRSTNDELRRSRSRLVTAADAERRRVERDLHDGAQQHIVAVSVKALLAQQAIGAGRVDEAVAVLDELKHDAVRALNEIRALAHGLYPSELASGLGEAFRVLAERATGPVRLDVRAMGRYDASVETCCYFCCAEALANVAKHAGTDTAATVRLVEHDGWLTLAVADDGPGFDHAWVPGQGLHNLRDRAGALGGSVTVGGAGDSGHGTVVTVRLPVTPVPAP